MRVRNFTPVIAALGFFLVLGTMAIPAYAHPWKGGWKAHNWAMHHPYKARRFAMRRRRMNFRRNHPYFQGNPGARRWARNNWQNNGNWAQNGYGRYGDDDDQGNQGYYNNGYYNNGYGLPFLGGYSGPGSWGNWANQGYRGPGNMYGHGHGDDDGD